MASTKAEIQLPYYDLEVAWSENGGVARTYVNITVSNQDGQGLPDPDAVADALRDWYSAQTGYVSSTLRRVETSSTTL